MGKSQRNATIVTLWLSRLSSLRRLLLAAWGRPNLSDWSLHTHTGPELQSVQSAAANVVRPETIEQRTAEEGKSETCLINMCDMYITLLSTVLIQFTGHEYPWRDDTSSKYPWSSFRVSRGDIINMHFLAEFFAYHCSLSREARTKEDAEHKGVVNFLLYTF